MHMVVCFLIIPFQLLSVISLLSSDTPNTDSPANVDAAKQVRGKYFYFFEADIFIIPSRGHQSIPQESSATR